MRTDMIKNVHEPVKEREIEVSRYLFPTIPPHLTLHNPNPPQPAQPP